jgi:hypothetical protein
MSELDNFLTRISKENKFEDSVPTKNPPKRVVGNDDSKMDGSLLFEGDSKRKSILDELDIHITEDEKQYFKESPNNVDMKSLIRSVLREELENFFKDKFILKESGDVETIVFKIGDSIFKGKLELLK